MSRTCKEEKINRIRLQLPETFDLIVGDNFELFYKGILRAIDPSHFDFELTFEDGNFGHAYKRKFEWTPEERDVGSHALRITVRDDNGDEVDTAKTVLKVSPKPSSPERERVVLCVGDSLTHSGIWCAEMYRRLTAKDGDPEGYGLSNIRFIGDKECNGAGYVGYGGWFFTSYTTSFKIGRFYHVFGDFRKTDADQHSQYEDEAGNLWKLESVSPTVIKLILVNGKAYALPTSGRLFHRTGGENREDIVYSSSEELAGNPFWYEDLGRVDFRRFAAERGAEKIDACYVLLGWNATYMEEEKFIAETEKFLDILLADFPDCKITLMGLQVPSRDGFGQNYGTDWKYYEKLSATFAINRRFEAIAKKPAYLGKVDTINIAGQFDTEYCMPSAEVRVNNRCAATEIRQSNGVHPSHSGYLQIGDAALRHFAARLSEK